MNLKFAFFLICCFLFSIPVFAAEDQVSWDVSNYDDLYQLYIDGIISDDVWEMFLNGEDISDFIPISEARSYQLSPNLDGSSVLVPLEESSTVKEVVDKSGETSLLLASVPTSGSAYSDPVLIGVEYVEADSGSLMDVIFNLVGSPVLAYHYRYQSNTNGQTVYNTQVLDYDPAWLASVLLLIVVIFCIFKAGGALLSRR